MLHGRIALVFTLAIFLTSASAIARQNAGAVQEWEDVYWDAPRPDGSLFGGRLRLPLPADPAHGPVFPASVTTIAGGPSAGGPDNRIDVVIVGDGYTAGELAQFHLDAANMAASFFAHEPYTDYADYFVVHLVDVVSNESGVDNDPVPGVDRDTALDMGFWCSGIERLLCVSVTKAYSYANNAPDVDHVIALANSSKYGGAGYTSSDLATSSGQNGSSPEIVVHELGHSFGNLADEYDYNDGSQWNGGEVPEPNVSILDAAAMANAGTKWASWLGVNDPLFDGLVDTYEGARYYQYGIYRPTSNSLMRSLFRPHNLPSIESLLIELYRVVSPLDDHADDGATYAGSETLWVVPMAPGGQPLPVQWYLDGEEIAGATGTTLDLGTLGLSECAHEVSAVVHDPTAWVRDEQARAEYMTASVTFQVYVPPADSTDCDANGLFDVCEIAEDPSLDWNGDGVLDECDSPNYCVANPNSTGVPAVISVDGTPVILTNDFTLMGTQLPLNEFGFFLMSESTAFVPLFGGSSGNLCLGGQIYRFSVPPTGEVLNSGPTGEMVFSPDLTDLPQGVVFQPGGTWYFQLWFRDFDPVNGPTSNTTDGIEIMFR